MAENVPSESANHRIARAGGALRDAAKTRPRANGTNHHTADATLANATQVQGGSPAASSVAKPGRTAAPKRSRVPRMARQSR